MAKKKDPPTVTATNQSRREVIPSGGEKSTAKTSKISNPKPKSAFKKGFLNKTASVDTETKPNSNCSDNNLRQQSKKPVAKKKPHGGFQKGFLNNKNASTNSTLKEQRGLRRGFLVSPPSSTRRSSGKDRASNKNAQPTSERHELLEVGLGSSTKDDSSPSTNPILLVQDNQWDISNSDNDNEKLRGSSLISLVEKVEDGDDTNELDPTRRQQEAGRDKTLIETIATISEEVLPPNDEHPLLRPLDNESSLSKSDAVEGELETDEKVPRFDDNDISQSAGPRNFVSLQRAWQGLIDGEMESSSDGIKIFVENLQAEEAVHVWKWIISDTTVPSKVTIAVGRVLIEQNPKGLIRYLQPGDTKDEKANALRAIQWLNSCFVDDSAIRPGSTQSIANAWSECLPSLVQLSTSSVRRTNLTVSAWKLGLNWIAVTAERLLLLEQDFGSDVVQNLVAHFQALLEVARQWNNLKNDPLTAVMHNDWKYLVEEYTSGDISPLQILQQFTGCFVSVPSDGRSIENVGGLGHTLSKTLVLPRWNVDVALKTLNAFCESDQPDYKSIQCLVRGLIQLCSAKGKGQRAVTLYGEEDFKERIGGALLKTMPVLSRSKMCSRTATALM